MAQTKPEKFTAQQMIDALKKTHGMVSYAADLLRCSPQTVTRYIRIYPTVAAAMDEFVQKDADSVELALIDEAINKRNSTVLMFLARTKFKDRGYTERVEVWNYAVPRELVDEAMQAIKAMGLSEQDVFRQLIEAGKVHRADVSSVGNDERADAGE